MFAIERTAEGRDSHRKARYKGVSLSGAAMVRFTLCPRRLRVQKGGWIRRSAHRDGVLAGHLLWAPMDIVAPSRTALQAGLKCGLINRARPAYGAL